jgi:hypothetical protein
MSIQRLIMKLSPKDKYEVAPCKTAIKTKQPCACSKCRLFASKQALPQRNVRFDAQVDALMQEMTSLVALEEWCALPPAPSHPIRLPSAHRIK